jgi:hypothetical protein
MQKSATTWTLGNPVTAAHLNEFNTDLATLFAEMSNDNITTTYNAN